MKSRPKLLLHICCAPDATAVFERLAPDFEVRGFFHNPNIYPEAEFKRRYSEAERVAIQMKFPLEEASYRPESWFRLIQGMEHEPEGGGRCAECFLYNLRATAAKAREMEMPFFTTTLTISPHKVSAKVLAAGKAAAREFGVEFIDMDFKKQDGFKRSLELSKKMRLYRQKYCGCKFSIRLKPEQSQGPN